MAQVTEQNLPVASTITSGDFIRCVDNAGESKKVSFDDLAQAIINTHISVIDINTNDSATVEVANNTKGILFFSSATSTSCCTWVYDVDGQSTITTNKISGDENPTITVAASSPQTDPISITITNSGATDASCFILQHGISSS